MALVFQAAIGQNTEPLDQKDFRLEQESLDYLSEVATVKNKGATAIIILGVIIAGCTLYYLAVILYNFGLFLIWATTEAYKFSLRKYYLWQEKRELRS